MVMFDYKQDYKSTKMIGVRKRCENCKRDVNYNMTNKKGKDIIPNFIGAVLFQHVGTT